MHYYNTLNINRKLWIIYLIPRKISECCGFYNIQQTTKTSTWFQFQYVKTKIPKIKVHKSKEISKLVLLHFTNIKRPVMHKSKENPHLRQKDRNLFLLTTIRSV